MFAILGLWEANKPTKKILARLEIITDGNLYGIICPEFFGHIKILAELEKITNENRYGIICPKFFGFLKKDPEEKED